MVQIRRNVSDRLPRFFRRQLLLTLLLAVLVMLGSPSRAQQLTGSLSGTVYDQSGAVVPKAHIVLTNQASGDKRSLVSDGAGHFVISAVQPATYSVSITAAGFSSLAVNDIVINQGDNRNVPNIKLQIGGNSSHVDVTSGVDAAVPLDTGEVSTSLNEKMIDQFPLAGRDAGELLKIMPGMALNTGNGQGSSFNDRVVGSNNGPVGAYSSDGTQPNGTMAYLLDGANLVDPGNLGTQIANINPDMIASIKVLQASYGAEYAKGPTIFEAFSRSGGAQFHGEGYLYTHNSILDSVDAYTKSQGGTNAAQQYYYAGGSVGGPVLLPHLEFNKNRNRLFFWAGYEYMYQKPAGSILNFNVPNAAQRAGDFSNANIPAAAVTTWNQFYTPPANNLPVGATATSIPIGDFDPNINGILKLYPMPNETPSASDGYNNYSYVSQEPQNRYEITGKVDYSINDNNKITASYSYQKETDIHPISIWWAQPWTLPYPSITTSPTATNLVMTNYTHVFNATTTNEFVFVDAHFVNPNSFNNPAATTRQANGFNVGGLFGHTTAQIPNFNGPYPGQLASISQLSLEPTFGGIKQAPALYDNFNKVIGEHDLKIGMYWDSTENTQNSTNADNGNFNFGGGTYSTANVVADLLLGRVNSYDQYSSAPLSTNKFHQWSIYGEDSWKVKHNLTVNIGLRADHIGQWYGQSTGFQVFNPAAYNNGAGAPNNTGLKWHAIDSSIPYSGWKSKFLQYSPRVSFAYDIFGTGKTVFRGGYATFRYQVPDVNGAGNGPLGAFDYVTPTSFEGYANVTQFTPPSSVAQNGSTITVMQMGDDRTPFTTDWNATISQAIPWRAVIEVSYVGNRSANELLDGTASHIFDPNNVPRGALFRPDPITGLLTSPAAPGCTTDQNNPIACVQYKYPLYNANDYRPLVNYQAVNMLSHAGYSKYNSFQVSFQKQSGPITFVTNYTFSKVLGLRDNVTDAGGGNGFGVDPFNLRNDYGVLAYDHTHILNFTYSWQLPSPLHTNRFLDSAVNGWQLSGYTAYQSGAPLQPNLGGNMNAQYPGALTVPTLAHPNLPDNSITLPNGLKSIGIGSAEWFGSSAYGTLVPALTCDPSKHLKSGQRFNPSCFTTPVFGQQGVVEMPYMRNPAYFDSDLGIYKNFRVTDTQKISFRVSATNFLNHPLRQFGLANQSDEQISFVNSAPATCAGCVSTVPGGATTPLTVQSLSPTNTNQATTGVPAFKTGARQLTLAVKYYF